MSKPFQRDGEYSPFLGCLALLEIELDLCYLFGKHLVQLCSSIALNVCINRKDGLDQK